MEQVSVCKQLQWELPFTGNIYTDVGIRMQPPPPPTKAFASQYIAQFLTKAVVIEVQPFYECSE